MKTLILAAGRAKEELNVLVPPGSNKVLLRIMGKPVIAYPLEAVSRVVGGETILVYRAGEERVLEEAKEHSSGILRGAPQLRGASIADAILAAKDYLDDTDYFTLVFGDIIFSHEALSQVLSTHLSEEPLATILVTPLDPEHAETYGVVEVDDYGNVKRVLEKPEKLPGGAPYYISGGIYILPVTILDYLENNHTLPQAINKLAKEGTVKTVYWSGLWIDIGYPWDLLEAVHELLSSLDKSIISDKAEIESTATIIGPVIIEDKTYIDHHALIKGPAYIGKKSFIGAHSFIRNHTCLNERTRVGAHAEVKHSLTQQYTLLDSKVVLADSVIGENTIIGAGTITLNILPEQEKYPRLRTHLVTPPNIKRPKRKLGAVIGYNTKINPGIILKPGTIIKPNTILQSPHIYSEK